MAIVIRDCAETDLDAVQAIYAIEVLEGTASFEIDPPDLDEIRSRYAAICDQGLPFLVALEGDKVAGYCYASAYRSRPAYRFTLENSVYVASWARQRGVGLILLNALMERVELGPWQQIIAIIGGSTHAASIRLHEQAGFQHVGVLKNVGFKFGGWVDSVIMQRDISQHD